MKTFSCTALSKTQDEREEHHNKPVKHLKEDASTSIISIEGTKPSAKFQTLLEVTRCELGRPKPSSSNSSLGPTKGWTPLYYAVYHSRILALRHFLRNGHSPHGVANLGKPPLCVAAAAGHSEIVKVLCEAGVDVNAPVKHSGETALHISIKSGRSDLTDVLLLYAPALDARTLDARETPLHYAAAKSGSLATVVSLIKRGADYEALNSKGCSPAEVALQSHNLHAAVAIVSAARGNRKKLVKEKEMLLKHVEKAQNRFSMNNELIGDIFEAGCPPDSTVLIESIQRNDAGLVNMFLEKGADPNRASAASLLPIFAALACSGSQIMHALILHKADVTLKDQNGNTVLQAAFESPVAHDRDVISKLFEDLLSNGADPLVKYADGSTLLHRAVEEGSGMPKIAQQLLRHGVQVNDQDKEGNTALHIAFHNRSCIAILLKHGANTSMVNRAGRSPLLHAAKNSTREKEPDLEQLVNSSNTSLKDSIGMTALHHAAQNGLEKTVRHLLHARSDTTAVDSKKRTPLLMAVLHQQWHLVSLFASLPGVNAWDKEGWTALHRIATSTPNSTSTWKDIALATAAFCEKGVSRTLREKSGATPLILAVKSLPEDGLPVVEALLARKGGERSNCVGHQDLDQHDALYYAATLRKPSFVLALLKNGSPFTLEDWLPSKGLIQSNSAAGKQVIKTMAEHEWLRRALLLQRQSLGGSPLTALLPIDDLRLLLTMGLDPNSPPRSKITRPLLWSILNQTSHQAPVPSEYLYDILKLLFEFGADPNVLATRNLHRASQNEASQRAGLTVHPLTFLLEQSADVDISLIQLFLNNSANVCVPSTFFKGRFPLHTAILNNRLDIAKLLLLYGANANCTDANGRTPLHLSIEQNAPETTSALLRAGAKIDAQDNAGNTALHIAALKANKQLTSTLLSLGAKPSKTNTKDKTPLDLISSNPTPENQTIIGLLQSADQTERRSTSPNTIPSSLSSSSQSAATTTSITTNTTTTSTTPAPKPQQKKPSMPRPPRTPLTPAQFHPSPPSPSPSPPNPTNPNKPSFEAGEPALATPVRLSKQVVSIRYTPPTPPARAVSGSKAAVVPAGADDANANADADVGGKEQRRVDSCRVFGGEGAVRVLDRRDTSFDGGEDGVGRQERRRRGEGRRGGGERGGVGGDVVKRESDEFASWLVVSGALDKGL